MKIPKELADLFQEYIREHKELGYRTVSQYVLHILQDHAKDVLKLASKFIEKKEEKKITLPSGSYTKEEIERLFKDS